MALLLRKKDRIEVTIEDIKVEIAPLSFAAKMEMNEVLTGAGEGDLNASMKASKIAMKHSIKKVEGIECLDGSAYELDFDGEILDEDCIDELLNLEQCPKLMVVCTALIAGISEKIIDPISGKELEGVEIKLPGKK